MNNKLIAIFMGAKAVQDGSSDYEMYGIIDSIEDGPNEQHFFIPKQMKFNESWDWLQPVVEKIEDLGYYVETYKSHVVIKPELDLSNTYYRSFEGTTKMNATYKAVVNFIEWYNNSK